MFDHLFTDLKFYLSKFKWVDALGVRIIIALLFTFAGMILLGGPFVRLSSRLLRARSREHTPEGHRAKDNTPTMGGLLIAVVAILNILLWVDLSDLKVWLFLLLFIGYGAIGALDDYSKISCNKGIAARDKFILQWLIGLGVPTLLLILGLIDSTIYIPVLAQTYICPSWLYVLWAAFVIVGCSNGVNLTDGLDCLAIGSLIPNFLLFFIISYLIGCKEFAFYPGTPFAYADQIAIIGAIFVGAALGFLRFNKYPAQIFMGDIGSLSLGAALAYMALICKQEFLLIISGGIFVIETCSVILQVGSFKLRGKKIFRMAPIHHHFELLGWPEWSITILFTIISSLLCLLAFVLFKI